MIWIDFGIICIGQEQTSTPSDMDDIIVEGHQRRADSEPFYNESDHFHTADKLLGCWYNVWLPKPICYDESFFEIAPEGVPYVEVVPKWSKCVEDILSFYINQSPINKIAVLLRIQDDSDDVVHPACSLAEFVHELSEGNIKWNELYFVQ